MPFIPSPAGESGLSGVILTYAMGERIENKKMSKKKPENIISHMLVKLVGKNFVEQMREQGFCATSFQQWP